jgi:xanthine dehydrogenase accessory factor
MWLKKIYEWKNQGIPCAMVTVIKAEGSVPRGVGSKMVVDQSGAIAGSIGGGPVEHVSREQALKCIAQDQCVCLDFSLAGDKWVVTEDTTVEGLCGGTLTVFIEPIIPKPEIVIFGGGHIGEKLSKFCDVLNLSYRVFDNREEFSSAERFPSAVERICKPYETLTESIRLTHTSYCVILTHGHKHDRVCLEQIVQNRDVPYIGMIGSKNKVRVIVDAVRANGGPVDERVYTPVGLKIGHHLPEEIALAIIAEIMLIINHGELKHMRIKP